VKSCNKNAHFEFVPDTAVYSTQSSKKNYRATFRRRANWNPPNIARAQTRC